MNVSKLLTGLALALPALATAAGPAAAQEPLSIRISVESTPGSPNQVILAAFRDHLKEEMGDAIEIEYFDSAQLGDEIVHMEQVRTGQIDVVPIGSDAVQLDAKWAIFDMPFLFPDRESAQRVLDGPIGEELKASFRETAGLEILGFGEVGFRQITNNVRPVVTPSDLEGLKLRTPGSRTRILAFEMLGATPITMNMGELYLALQQGTVDGQENPLSVVESWSLYEVQDYLSLSNHVYTPTTFSMNLRRYEGLTDEQKEAFQTAARLAVEDSRAYSAEADQSLVAELEGEVEINEIDVAAFQEAARPIWDEIAKVAGEAFTKRVIDAATSE